MVETVMGSKVLMSCAFESGAQFPDLGSQATTIVTIDVLAFLALANALFR